MKALTKELLELQYKYAYIGENDVHLKLKILPDNLIELSEWSFYDSTKPEWQEIFEDLDSLKSFLRGYVKGAGGDILDYIFGQFCIEVIK